MAEVLFCQQSLGYAFLFFVPFPFVLAFADKTLFPSSLLLSSGVIMLPECEEHDDEVDSLGMQHTVLCMHELLKRQYF